MPSPKMRERRSPDDDFYRVATIPKIATSASDKQIRRAKATDKRLKFFDGGGLYLKVQPTGGKFWRFRFRQANGKGIRSPSDPIRC